MGLGARHFLGRERRVITEPIRLRFDAIVLEFDIPKVGIVGIFIKTEVLGWLL